MSKTESILKAIEYTDKAIDLNISQGRHANWNTNDSLIAQRVFLIEKLIVALSEQEADNDD